VGAAMRSGQVYLLHRVNPCVKLLAAVTVVVVLTFVFDPLTPAIVLLLTLLAGRFLGGLSFAAQLKPMLVFFIAGLAILVANILFNKENAVSPAVVDLGFLRVTRAALWAAGSLWLRLLLFALVSLVFVKTTSPQDFILSLVHQLKVNYRVAYGTMVGYRMLPLLVSDYHTIRAAQRVRGSSERSGLLHPWWWLRRFAIPLLAGAVRRASRVAVAMDARAFGAFPERTYRVRMRVDGKDLAFLAAVLVVLAVVVAGTWVAGVARFTVQ